MPLGHAPGKAAAPIASEPEDLSTPRRPTAAATVTTAASRPGPHGSKEQHMAQSRGVPARAPAPGAAGQQGAPSAPGRGPPPRGAASPPAPPPRPPPPRAAPGGGGPPPPFPGPPRRARRGRVRRPVLPAAAPPRGRHG